MPALLMRNGGVALLLDHSGAGLPRVLYWGADHPSLSAGDLDPELFSPATPHSAMDGPWPFTLSPTSHDGWSGRPGAAVSSWDTDGSDSLGRRSPRALQPRWSCLQSPPLSRRAERGADVVLISATDPDSQLDLRIELELQPSGLLRVRHGVELSPLALRTARVGVRELMAVLPLPERATQILDLTGRWCRERSPQRVPIGFGSWVRESRRGRTGHDAATLMSCGTAGFGFNHGEVWALHVGWSGNHVHYAERLSEGAGWHGGPVLGGGELLADGEVVLAPGERYLGPWCYFAYGENGLDSASARIHEWLRSRPKHPDPVEKPRPLVLNTWEAVYFDHDLERLTELAEVAARVGVERFVLDDGWFGGRRHDRAGLGDWLISQEVWPHDSLRLLADRVRGLGMEFGIWFEPEMVNLDSDLVREHPQWLLGPDAAAVGRSWRHQYLLDLSRPEVFELLAERISALVTELDVAYIKWDHNRDLHEMPAHAQTLALYRLLDLLRERHPGLEIESCASGGARVDLGVIEHSDRVWASDTNDAIERQQIQRFTTLLLPPELVGSHLGGPRSHTTARVLDQSMRAITALFAHAGIEWDLTACSVEELEAISQWAGLYKELRPLLHTGTVVRADLPSITPDSPEAMLHGVVSLDRSHAVFAYVRLQTEISAHPGRLRLPGLDTGRKYHLLPRPEAGAAAYAAIAQPFWWETAHDSGVTVPGAVLAEIGLPAPMLHPAQAVLLELRAVD